VPHASDEFLIYFLSTSEKWHLLLKTRNVKKPAATQKPIPFVIQTCHYKRGEKIVEKLDQLDGDPVLIDQLQQCIELIRTDPTSRQILFTAWVPMDIPKMALPPCHGAVLLSR